MDNTITMPNGLMARLNTSDAGTWHDVFDEDKSWHRPPAWFKPKVIVDLGAYVGYTSYDFRQQFPNARIIAIEPDSSNFELLLQNTRGCDIEAKKCAVSNYNGYGELMGEAFNGKILVQGIAVRVITLNQLIEEFNLEFIDYLKIDIEGSERKLFNGY